MEASNEGVSLNKYISSTGVCSRREADRWIDAGRVTINGKAATRGNRVLDGDKVCLDGRPIRRKAKPVYLAFHKPAGVTCTTDQRDPSNLVDFLKYKQRIFPVGRLDKASTGLLLLTNDGDIVNKILRAENAHDKEYIVKVDQPITGSFLAKMRKGVPILGTVTKPCPVERLSANVFRITLTQGLNRQIRRMCEHLGYQVLTLKRIRIMHLTLDGLKPGAYRELTPTELKTLLQAVKGSRKTAKASPPRRSKPKK